MISQLPERHRAAPTLWHARVLANQAPAAPHYRQLRLEAPPIAANARPGQFVMLTAGRTPTDHVLPRPMAIYTRDAEAGTIDIVYSVVGAGTRALASFRTGEHMIAVGPLGQGFALQPATARVLLIGRGIGICSLTSVAQDLAHFSAEVFAVLSARDRMSVIGIEVFEQYGARAVWPVTDAEGTSGVPVLRERLHTQLDDRPPELILTGGSRRLMRLCADLGRRWGADIQVSLEAHMACGLGYCHGCASGQVNDSQESPLICRDGPVFRLQPDPNEPEDQLPNAAL
jgi:dihydroorotate dehydrogenase electron transfer subunit